MNGYLFVLLSGLQNVSLFFGIVSGLSSIFCFYLFVLSEGKAEVYWMKRFKISFAIFTGAIVLAVIIPQPDILMKGAFLNYASGLFERFVN